MAQQGLQESVFSLATMICSSSCDLDMSCKILHKTVLGIILPSSCCLEAAVAYGANMLTSFHWGSHCTVGTTGSELWQRHLESFRMPITERC